MNGPLLEHFKGVCRLAFEGQEFTPTDENGTRTGPTLWVRINNDLRRTLVEELRVDTNELQWLSFQIEFLGRSALDATGAGHLNLYPGSVSIEKIISARAPPREDHQPTFRSLRERLRSLSKRL